MDVVAVVLSVVVVVGVYFFVGMNFLRVLLSDACETLDGSVGSGLRVEVVYLGEFGATVIVVVDKVLVVAGKVEVLLGLFDVVTLVVGFFEVVVVTLVVVVVVVADEVDVDALLLCRPGAVGGTAINFVVGMV